MPFVKMHLCCDCGNATVARDMQYTQYGLVCSDCKEEGERMPQNKLAHIRRAKDETLLDLYNKSGIPVYHLSDIECGKVLPVMSEMKVLTDLYGISAQEIWDIVDPAVGHIGSREKPESEEAYGKVHC